MPRHPKKQLSKKIVEITNKVQLQILLTIFIIFLSLGLSSIIIMLYYGVPMGDDYLAIKTFSDPQNWLSEAWYSLTHTGRYAQSITSSTAYGLLGSSIAVILPTLTIAWLYVLIYLYLKLFLNKINSSMETYQKHLLSIGVLISLIFSGHPIVAQNIDFMYQGFFFSSAIVTYTISILATLSLFYLFLTQRNTIKKKPVLFSTLLYSALFYVNLHNEVLPVTLLMLSIVLLVISLIPSKKEFITNLKKHRRSIGGVTLTTLLALAVMFFSPSRIARSAAVSSQAPSHSILDIISSTFEKTLSAFTFYVDKIDLVLLILLATFTIVSIKKIKKDKLTTIFKWGLSILILGILSTIASMGMQVIGYGVNTGIYGRVMLLSHSIFIIGLLMTFIGIIGLVKQKIPKNSLTMLLILFIYTTISGLALNKYIASLSGVADAVKNYNTDWAQQDKLLKNHSENSPAETIYLNETTAGIGDGFSFSCTGPYSNSTSWLNEGMESYYGVEKICSTTDIKE